MSKHNSGDEEGFIQSGEILSINHISDVKLQSLLSALCVLTIQSRRSQATGFLCKIAFPGKKQLRGLFTCHHVMNKKCNFSLYFEECDLSLNIEANQICWCFTDSHLDVTFIVFHKTIQKKLEMHTFLPVSQEESQFGSRVRIMQHPAGGIACKSTGNVIKFDNVTEQGAHISHLPHYLLYLADTLIGSSGSPVLNDREQVVAIHTNGVYDKKDSRRCICNVGTSMRNVIEAIQTEWQKATENKSDHLSDSMLVEMCDSDEE